MVQLLNCRDIIGISITIDFTNDSKKGFEQPKILLKHAALQRSRCVGRQVVIVAIFEGRHFSVPKFLVRVVPDNGVAIEINQFPG